VSHLNNGYQGAHPGICVQAIGSRPSETTSSASGYKKLQSCPARRMADEKSSIWMIDICF
jgi:hypothetical protein